MKATFTFLDSILDSFTEGVFTSKKGLGIALKGLRGLIKIAEEEGRLL
jgi:hypothetical protein